MKNKKRTKIATLLMSAAMLTTAFAMPVSAETAGNIEDALIVDSAGSEGENTLLPSNRLSLVSTSESDKGSITITLSDGKGEGTSKEGVEFSCLKIADIEKGEYVLDDTYESLGIDINELKNSSDLEAAATKIAEVAENGTLITTDMNGKLTFSDLEVGVYLIEASNDEKYDDVTPLLISIPTWNEDDGVMDYEVNVIPKHTPKPKTPKEECPQTTTKPCPQTGVDSYTWLYFGGAAAVVVALVVVNTVAKKKRA